MWENGFDYFKEFRAHIVILRLSFFYKTTDRFLELNDAYITFNVTAINIFNSTNFSVIIVWSHVFHFDRNVAVPNLLKRLVLVIERLPENERAQIILTETCSVQVLVSGHLKEYMVAFIVTDF